MHIGKAVGWSGAVLCGLALCGCAHISCNPAPVPNAQNAANASPKGEAHDNPVLSAEQVGQRFLTVFEGLTSRNALSVERLQAAVGIHLKHVAYPSEKLEAYFYGRPLKDGWNYILDFNPASASLKQGASLSFVKDEDEFSSMANICGLDFDYYREALKVNGFTDYPVYGEIGQLQSWRFSKILDDGENLTLSMRLQNEVAGTPGRLCVRSLATMN